MDHPNIKLLLTPGNKKKLTEIEETCGVHMVRNVRKGSLVIYGTEASRNLVLQMINA